MDGGGMRGKEAQIKDELLALAAAHCPECEAKALLLERNITERGGIEERWVLQIGSKNEQPDTAQLVETMVAAGRENMTRQGYRIWLTSTRLSIDNYKALLIDQLYISAQLGSKIIKE